MLGASQPSTRLEEGRGLLASGRTGEEEGEKETEEEAGEEAEEAGEEGGMGEKGEEAEGNGVRKEDVEEVEDDAEEGEGEKDEGIDSRGAVRACGTASRRSAEELFPCIERRDPATKKPHKNSQQGLLDLRSTIA
mmetsp:Transcript_59842/g.106382  ORF Transcript_59842/g.106382 Transcript_59842/m.106382 type:complete len:135 (-) Transcript_59842:57-461(-)